MNNFKLYHRMHDHAFFLLLRAKALTFLMYSSLLFLYKLKGYCWAGLSMFGSSLSNFWTPSKICLTVMWGFQSSSSFKIDKQTVPEGYMLGWGSTGLNTHFGGLAIKMYT